jgi:hypothetical protein
MKISARIKVYNIKLLSIAGLLLATLPVPLDRSANGVG